MLSFRTQLNILKHCEIDFQPQLSSSDIITEPEIMAGGFPTNE